MLTGLSPPNLERLSSATAGFIEKGVGDASLGLENRACRKLFILFLYSFLIVISQSHFMSSGFKSEEGSLPSDPPNLCLGCTEACLQLKFPVLCVLCVPL